MFFCSPAASLAKHRVLILLWWGALITGAAASDDTYYDRFLEVSKTQKGFISDVTLVKTNNVGANLTNAPLPFSRFAQNGELAGVKLGMNMSQVVEVWGKPHLLFTFCGLGPRFWYHPSKYFGDITLAFKENRLAIIALDLAQMRSVTFDNGLSGRTSDLEFEKFLGSPTLRIPRTRGWFFGGEVAYCTNGIRTDLHFSSISVPQSARNQNVLWMLSVSSRDAEHPIPVVTITNLLNYPQSYDGIRIQITGYLKPARELSALYQNQEDASQSRDDKVWISPVARPGHEKKVQSIKEGKVRVVGVVDCGLRNLEFGVGRSNQWDIRISELELLEEIKD
jgi:hypothetical protein